MTYKVHQTYLQIRGNAYYFRIAVPKKLLPIAILALKTLTGKEVLERSRKGPGFDYWVGDKDDDQLFSGKARLEVSGILCGDEAKIKSRVTQKKAQTKPSGLNHSN
ncbi:MAG: hypothetical protein V1721_02960 [Pseudomonadota bacterium]